MRIASFNVENMFRRPVLLNGTEQIGDKIPLLDEFSELQQLLELPAYNDAVKTRMVDLLVKLDLADSDSGDAVILRRAKQNLLVRRKTGIEIVATGRGDWIGWLELRREAVDEVATRNTARVVKELNADVICVVEAEDRPALLRFDQDVLPNAFASAADRWRFEQIMLIDGNDDRGIDVGIMTRNGYGIDSMRSHVADRDDVGEVYSRDCAEYLVSTPGGDQVLIMVNHFKSKSFSKPKKPVAGPAPETADSKRTRQSIRTAAIYNERKTENELIAVVGDLNDTPDSLTLRALLSTDLIEVSTHPNYDENGGPGTYARTNDKIDYVLCSPQLFALMQAGGTFRKGVWRSDKATKHKWERFDTLTREVEAASDHAAVWADFDL